MAPSSPSFLAVVLTLLTLGVMSGAQAKPVEHPVLNLDITSSIKIGRPHFGEKLGPFAVGQELTLTCSTEASESVSLSWWEGDTEQESSDHDAEGIISSSFTIQTLRIEDNGRRFICRDEETQTKKSIEISINSVPVLAITSSLKMGQPIFGDTVGPFTAGQQLTLTCSSEASGSVSLSWWEGDTKQESSVHDAEGIISSSFTIQTLRIEDNGRRFTCRDEETQTNKFVEVRINTDALAIIKDDNPIEDGEVVKGIAGQNFIINCIVQGYSPSAASWWKDGAELESVSSKSLYATNSVLSLKALTVDDSGRSLTCRSLNGQLSKTVILDVEAVLVSVQEENPLALALIILLSILLIAAVFVMVFFIIKTLNNKKGEKRRSDTVMEDSEVISGGIVDNRWAKIPWESQYGKLIEIAPQSVSEHDEGPNAL